MNDANKQRKTIEWERLEIFSRKLEIPREHFRQGWAQDRNSKDLTEAEEIKKRQQEKNYMKKILMTQIATMLLSLT